MSEDDSRQDADSAERSGDKPRRSWLDRISAALSGEPTTREDLVELLTDDDPDTMRLLQGLTLDLSAFAHRRTE